MIRLLKWLFTGDFHLHKWKTVDVRKVQNMESKAVVCELHIMECVHCGERKVFRVDV